MAAGAAACRPGPRRRQAAAVVHAAALGVRRHPGGRAERSIDLSCEQVFRLVTQPPQRLSMDTLAALCDILDCQPGDLIEVKKVSRPVRKAAGSGTAPPPVRVKPVRDLGRGLARLLAERRRTLANETGTETGEWMTLAWFRARRVRDRASAGGSGLCPAWPGRAWRC